MRCTRVFNEMAKFRRMRLVELHEAWEMRGLDHGGRNKKGLIQLLNRYESERAWR